VKKRTRAARVRRPNTRITIEEFVVEHKPLVAKLSKDLRKSFKHTGGERLAVEARSAIDRFLQQFRGYC